MINFIKKYQKSDYETICLENNELKEINERLESENQELLYKYGNILEGNEEYKKFLEKTIKGYIPDYELEELVNRYKNESFIPRVEVKKILEDRRK